MSELLTRDEIESETLAGEAFVAAMLLVAQQVDRNDSGLLYKVPGWGHVQDALELPVKAFVCGVEVPILEALRGLEGEFLAKFEQRGRNACFERAANFFKVLDSLQVHVMDTLQKELALPEDGSAPTQSAELLTKQDISDILQSIIPPIRDAAAKWSDFRTVASLDKVSTRLNAVLSGDSE